MTQLEGDVEAKLMRLKEFEELEKLRADWVVVWFPIPGAGCNVRLPVVVKDYIESLAVEAGRRS